jgi:hypothetical protein
VDSLQISKLPPEVFSLPKQVNKVLHDRMALKQELTHFLEFTRIEVESPRDLSGG